MKFVAFRIQNFKSIVDSGWQNLSTDNITGIIGQNESGKTAILEALNAFYIQALEQDFIRGDGVFPTVSCSFETNKDELLGFLEESSLPEEFLEQLEANKNRINISSVWTGEDQQAYVLEQVNLLELFNKEPVVAEAEPAKVVEEVVEETATTPTEPEEKVFAPTLYEIDEVIDAVMSKIPKFVFFVDFDSLLPKDIDVSNIDAKPDPKRSVQGLVGARNFLKLANITTSELSTATNPRLLANKVNAANTTISNDFQDFWTQRLGKDSKIKIEMRTQNHPATEATKSGKPYLEFWVHDGKELLHPAQRSKGVRWFLSFFLQIRAAKGSDENGIVLLIDEPGSSLHARAQNDVMRLLEDESESIQILYTTHSPYLIEKDKLFRLLAVERAEDDVVNDSKVYGIHKLGSASADTMFPVYTLIGVDLQHQRAVKDSNNVLLEEPSAFYYLQAFKKLVASEVEMNFLPATGADNLPLFVNLFLGWGLDFIVVADNDDKGKKVIRKIKKDVFGGDDALAKGHLYNIAGADGIEDVFTKQDFKQHVLKDSSASYTDSNSVYAKQLSSSDQNFSKVLLAIEFLKQVEAGTLTLDKLNSTTQKSIKSLIEKIESMLGGAGQPTPSTD